MGSSQSQTPTEGNPEQGQEETTSGATSGTTTSGETSGTTTGGGKKKKTKGGKNKKKRKSKRRINKGGTTILL